METLDVDYLEIKTKNHPDSSFNIKSPIFKNQIPTHLWISSGTSPSQTFLWILMVLMDIKAQNNWCIETLIIPYFPFSREKKSATALCSLLKKSGLKTIVTLDYHAPETLEKAPLDIINLLPTKIISQCIKSHFPIENTLLLAPDQGSHHRCSLISKETGIPFVTLEKRRDSVTNLPLLLSTPAQLSSLKGKKILIIDDILDSGATLNETVKLVENAGAQDCHALITHGVCSQPYKKPPFLKTIHIGNTLNNHIKKEAFMASLDFSAEFTRYFQNSYLEKRS